MGNLKNILISTSTALLSLHVGDCVRPQVYTGLNSDYGEILKVVSVNKPDATVKRWVVWDQTWGSPRKVTLGNHTIFGAGHVTNRWERIKCPVDKKRPVK